MAKIFTSKRSPAKVAVVERAIPDQPMMTVGQQSILRKDLNPTMRRFNQFWDMMETIERHGYLRAAEGVVGRSAVGAGWTLRRHPEYGKGAPERHRKRLFAFYNYQGRKWDNIKDFASFAAKLKIAAKYLHFFGQAAFQVIKDENGQSLGLDFLYGLVVPNVDTTGKFKSPAFVQYPTRNPAEKVEFSSPNDIVFITDPDWEGSPMGSSDIEALTSFTLPLDLYLMTAAREYMKNRDTPEVVYQLPPDISQEAFDLFVKTIESKHRGPNNVGRNPIAIQGEFKIHELRPLPAALPYQQSRQEARSEELAAAGVNEAKLGLANNVGAGGMRELRREFHETSLLPLFILIETALYEQVHVRTFSSPGWEFKFNSPDFLNAVERATVHMRYRQMGVYSPNDVRYQLGDPPRKDPQGALYEGQAVDEDKPEQDTGGNQGSPPEGRPIEPDAPSQTGEPTMDDDPERGDQHDDRPRENVLHELRTWRRFAVRRLERGKSLRSFETTALPHEIVEIIAEHLGRAKTADQVAQIFDEVIAEVERAL